MLAGIAKADITPAHSVGLTGYLARLGPSQGAHDPIHARALVLADGAQQAALVVCDTLGFGIPYTQQAKRAIEAATGIPTANIMLAATHTHSAPASVLLHGCDELELDWLASLPAKMAEAVRAAQANLAQVEMLAGHADVPGVARNRRDPAGPVDNELRLIVLRRPDGQIQAALLGFSCHAVVLGPNNRLISADFPGAACARTEELLGAPTMYLQAPCGDINPTNHGGDFTDVAWSGEQLAQAAARLVATPGAMQPVPCDALSVTSRPLTLPLNAPLEFPALLAYRDDRLAKAAEARADGGLMMAKDAQAMSLWAAGVLKGCCTCAVSHEVQVEIQAIRAGDLTLIGVPGELFVDFEMQATRQARERGKQALVLAYCNGDIGYIPTADSYSRGGYEVDRAYRYYGYPAAVSPEAGERIRAAIAGSIG